MELYIENYEELNRKRSHRNRLLRHAVIEVYNYTCAYTGVRVEPNDFHMDHILPEKFLDDKYSNEWSEHIEHYELPDDFQIESLLNYAPARAGFNSDKSDKIYPKMVIATHLINAKNNALKILNEIEDLKTERSLTKAMNLVEKHCLTNPDNKEKMRVYIEELSAVLEDDTEDDLNCFELYGDNSQELNKALDTLSYHFSTLSTKEKDDALKKLFEKPYNEIKNINNDGFNMARSSVQISGFPPKVGCYLPSYVITFTKVTLSDMMITPDYEYTKNYLFKKVFSEDMRKRGFFVTKFYEHDKNVFLQVGNARFDIPHHTANELSEIVDEYYIWYTDLLLEIERKRGTLNAQLFSEGNYVIAEMPKELWNLIAGYIDEKSGGDWRGLEKGYGKFIKLFESPGLLNVYLRCEVIEGKAYILWTDFYERQHMCEYWNFEKAFNWFFNDLIPDFFKWDKNKVEDERKIENSFKNQVRYLLGRKNTVISRKGDYGYDLKKYIENLGKPDQFINLDQKFESDEYVKIVQRLQYFYDVLGNWTKIYLSTKQLDKIFKAMLIILKKDGVQTHPNYLVGNLSFINKGFKEMEDLVCEIEKAIQNTECLNDYGICFAIRNIQVASEDCGQPFTADEIEEILEKLKPLIEFYNRNNVMEKVVRCLKTEILGGY
jgi:hypothetical protein